MRKSQPGELNDHGEKSRVLQRLPDRRPTPRLQNDVQIPRYDALIGFGNHLLEVKFDDRIDAVSPYQASQLCLRDEARAGFHDGVDHSQGAEGGHSLSDEIDDIGELQAQLELHRRHHVGVFFAPNAEREDAASVEFGGPQP